MKKLLSKLALFITGSAMAIGVGVATFKNDIKEVNAAYSGVSPYVITLDNNSLGSENKMITAEATTKIGGIDLTWNHLNATSGQMKSNDSGDSNFYIYNKDALPGKITNIVVTFTNGSSYTPKAKVATSAYGAGTITVDGSSYTNKDGSVCTWNFDTANATYFCVYMQTGTGTIKASTISIYYEQTPTSIEFNENSNPQTVFYVDDTFSTSGLIVDVNYANGGKETITKDNDYTVSEPDLSTTGNKTVTISPKAGGKAVGCDSITYDITVNPAHALESVTLTGDLTNKTYTIGDSWDLTGISVTGNYNDSSHENLGTLNSLITAEKVTFTLDPVKPELGGTTLDIKNLKYEGTYNATETLHITGIVVSEKVRYVLFEEETLTTGDYMLVTSDNYAVTNELTGNEKRVVASNDFEITNNCIFEPDIKFSYAVAKDGDYYTFFNSATSKYLAGTTANESGFVDAVDDYARWTVTRENDGYKLVNKVVSGYLQKNSSGEYFGCYTSGALGVLYLYKQLPPIVKVTVVDNKTTIGLGGTATITTELLNGAAYTATFSSDDLGGTYAELTDNGDGTATVTAVSAGTVTITTSALGCEDVETVFTIKDIALVEKITVETQPTKVEYTAGEVFSSDGLTIKVTYSDNSTSVKTSGFTTSEVDTSSKGVKVVTVSYTEEDITRTTTFEITVSYPSLTVTEAIEIIKPLEKQTPTAETYRVTGKVVDKEWNGNSTEGYANINIAVKYNEQDPDKIFQIFHALQGDKDTFNQITIGAGIIVESKLQKFVKSSVDIYETVANPDIVDFDLVVDKLVTGISVHREPNKTQYYVGDSTFDYAGTVMYIHYNTGSEDRETVKYDDDPAAFLAIFEFTNPDTSVSKAYVPVTITHKASGFTASFNVSVSDVKPSSISVTKNPNKLTYASGEEFDPTGIEVTVKNNNGSTFIAESSKLTYRTPSQDGKVYEGDTNVTVIYNNNNNITAKIAITVAEKYVLNITASISEGWNDDTYDIGGTFNTRSLVILVNYNDGTFDKYTSKNSDFGLFNIETPDMSTGGDKEVKITLKGTNHSTTVTIHVKGIEELYIDQLPYRTTYRVGDELDFNGLELSALYNNSDVEEVSPTWDSVTITGDTSVDGPDQYITFTYKGKSASYQIDVWMTDEGMETLITSEIAKLRANYLEDEYTSENWVKVKKIIDDTEDVLSEFDPRNEGEHYSSDVMGWINDAIEEINKIPVKTLDKITVSGPTKTSYVIGEKLDISGLVVTAHYEDGSTKTIESGKYSLSEVDMSTTGEKTITVTYGNKTASFTITVNESAQPVEKTLDSISLSGAIKNSYVVGEELDTSGLIVTATYSDQSSAKVTGWMVSGYDKNVVGEQTVTISYTEGTVTKTATFTVTVNEKTVDPRVEEAREAAIGEYLDFFDSIDLSGYSEEVIAQFNALKAEALASLGEAATEEEIAAALANARTALNNLLAANPKPQAAASVNLGLVLGLSIGGGVLLLAGILALIFLPKKKKIK